MWRRSSTGSAWVTSSPSRKMRPARRLDEPVDHLQRRRLAAPRRADEHADLARRGCRATARAPRPAVRDTACRPRRGGSSASAASASDPRRSYRGVTARAVIGLRARRGHRPEVALLAVGRRPHRRDPRRLIEHIELTVLAVGSGCSSRSRSRSLSVRYRRVVRADARDHRRALHDPVARAVRAAGAAHRAVVARPRSSRSPRTRC